MAGDYLQNKKWLHAFSDRWYDFIARANTKKEDHGERGAKELEAAGDAFARNFKNLVGRDPTMVEAERFFNDVLYGDNVALVSDPNKLRPILQSYVYDQYAGVGDEEKQAAVEEKAKGQAGSVQNLFQSILGRDPTKAETDHFSKALASGDLDEYALTEGLKQLPEYVQKQDESARQNLRGELSTADTRYYQENILPAIQARFAQQGRSVDSSSFAAALANSAKEVNNEREKYLATLGYQDYANRRQSAVDQYQQNLARQDQLQDYSTARTDQLMDATRNRAIELQNYDLQKAAYDEYLRRYGARRQKKSIGGFAAGLVGGGLGAYFGGPTGASAGFNTGSAIGSFFD